MSKQAVMDYSTTAASNTDVDGTDSTGATGLVKSGDNYVRSIMAHVKGYALDLGSVVTVGGTADAITVTLASAPSALADGMRFTFNASAANTGATTLNVTPAGGSAFGAKKVMKWSAGSEAELSAGDISAANALVEVIYDTARNGAAGAWMILGSAAVAAATTTQQLTGTSAAVYSTPDSVAALWEKGSGVASAATISLGEGGFFHITGTTTITDLDFDTAKDGRTVDVVFDGALTLTHNGTTLQLPGAANITTAAGDRARFVQDSSDNIICLWYQRASSIPGWETIDVQTLSGAASYAKTDLSAYRILRLTYDLTVSTDSTTLTLRTDSDNGASYDAGASDYGYQVDYAAGTGSAGIVAATATGIPLHLGANVGNATGEGNGGTITLTNFNQAAYCKVIAEVHNVRADGSLDTGIIGGRRLAATARNAFTIIPGGGTISGHFVLEGIRG